MSHLSELERINFSLRTNSVKEVLPQYFTEDYPNLIAFLEGYYDYVDSDEVVSVFEDLYGIRDIERASLTQLDQIFAEIASGASRDYFADPREVLRNFAQFYRVKGTKYSAEGFFRAFFGIDVDIQHPKRNIFVVGESEIGTESLRYIQNGALYQIFSVLLRTSIPLETYEQLYKKFVHPAGFYLGAEVLIENQTEKVFAEFQPQSIPDSASGTLTVEGVGNINLQPFNYYNGVLEDTLDSGAGAEYIHLEGYINKYKDLTASLLYSSYDTLKGILDANSPQFSDSAVSIRFSEQVERMDRDLLYIDSAVGGYGSYMLDGYVDSDYVGLN
jgi:hypothetical protein